MSDLITIAGARRSETGKNYARKIRAKGLIPANILDNAKATAIEFDPKWLSKAFKNGKEFNLELEGVARKVRIHELQVHPTKRIALHVDLMYV